MDNISLVILKFGEDKVHVIAEKRFPLIWEMRECSVIFLMILFLKYDFAPDLL